MKDWLRKRLGIADDELRIAVLEMQARQMNKRIGRIDSKPLRYEQVQRARKLARKRNVRTGTPY